jgi:predicted O-methyltransferase YrrM
MDDNVSRGHAPGRAETEADKLRRLKVEYGKLLKRLETRSGQIELNTGTNADPRAASAAVRAAHHAVEQIARDANAVVQSKYWKRTKVRRRLANSLRKMRGRPKKRWPTEFDPQSYLSSTAAGSSARLDLIPLYGRSMEPHLTCVCMVRNEAKRADDMMRHLCALFDRVVVIDHLSTDGTAQIVARHDGHADTEVVLLKGTDPGYHQSEYMTAVARRLIDESRSDWLFFLDFDEILPFRTRAELLQALVPLGGADVIHSHWYNLALENGHVDTLQGASATIGPTVSPYTKVALNVRDLKSRDIKIDQGNHAVFLDGSDTPYIGERAFGLFHVPVSGADQFRAKLEQGVRAYEEISGDTSTQGTHWRELNAQADRLTGDAALLKEVALRYGEPFAKVLTDVEAGKLTRETRPITLDFAQTDPAPDASAATEDAPEFDLETIDAVMALTFPVRPADSATALAGLSKAIHETLPLLTRRLDPEPAARAARVHHAMISAAMEIEVLALPTAWSGHKAFLFSLMEAMRPRRYVELGTHAGASFYAACQHMKLNGAYGEAIAIDIWEGDHQAGFYTEKVFEDFKFRLNRHFPGIGSYIRGYFEEAVKLFEPGSIDLLHIDGLHTYEAVKHDFETWRDALAPDGTIIFHDTSEYQTDFAVWQLFEEIAPLATASFRFRHCHGLGVLAFGDRDVNPAIELLEHLGKNPALSEAYYATLGSALFEQARSRAV